MIEFSVYHPFPVEKLDRPGKDGYPDPGGGADIDRLVVQAGSAMETLIQIYLVEKRIPQRIGNRYEFIYPYDTFRARDGWVVIAVGNDAVWTRFCKAIGRGDLLDMERFRKNADRVAANRELNEIVTEWTGSRSMKEIIELLLANSVPCSPIYTVDQIVTDPHIAGAREMIVDIPHQVSGSMKVVNCPIKLTENPARIVSAASKLGQHNAEILDRIAGNL